MADEFIKGFGILTGAGLIWMILAGNFLTPSFGGPQLTGPRPEDPTTFETLGLLVMDVAFWFAILGAITFWVLIPLASAGREYLATRGE